MRQDDKKTKRNQGIKTNLKSAISKAKKSKENKDMQTAFSALDKAAKKHLIHKNSADRLKSRLAKQIASAPKAVKEVTETKVKKSVKKKTKAK